MSAAGLLADGDLDATAQGEILDDAAARKAARRERVAVGDELAGRSVALVFEKPSTRTRLSFEVAVHELGAHPVVVDAATTQLGRGEPLEDTAQVLSRYVAGIVFRTFGQDRLERLAGAASVPVVNALTDLYHPCQVLADLLTLRESVGPLPGRTLTYLGDGNNVAHSLLVAGATAGMHVRVATPVGYEPDEGVVAIAAKRAADSGGSVSVTTDPRAASEGTDALYTDVWTSMGQEAQAADRVAPFRGYALDEEKLELAAPGAVVLHCLPAHRGEEITAAVVDGPRSVVFEQVENRLHAQKALLARLLGAVS